MDLFESSRCNVNHLRVNFVNVKREKRLQVLLKFARLSDLADAHVEHGNALAIGFVDEQTSGSVKLDRKRCFGQMDHGLTAPLETSLIWRRQD